MRHYVVDRDPDMSDKTTKAYLNAYLLCNFGIVVDKPQALTREMIKDISEVYKLNVPASFYSNPQDTKFYSRAELLIEQLVSYFLVETGTGIYDHVEIFNKDLPEYKVGDEIKLREFKILTQDEALEVLAEIAKSYCDYTRPFSLEEIEEFKLLFKHGLVNPAWEIGCKDNIFNLLPEDINFARFLDKKDLVKLSVKLAGEHSDGLAKALKSRDTDNLVGRALPLVKGCTMTKKQAKYFNKLVSIYGTAKDVKVKANSPYKTATALLKEGKVVEAARVYAKNGSLLERNLRMLLSRANPKEAMEIIDMIKSKNPIVLYQLIQSLEEEAGKSRTFTFTKNNLVKKHVETDYETKWRKSRLSSGTVKFLHEACVEKIYAYYRSLESLGKVYVSDTFYKLGLPANTSASGKGIDVIPTGSRLGCTGTGIRTFVTWKGVYDIDAALTCVKADGHVEYIYFGNYSMKPFGHDILFSGDCRGSSGTEYYDINLENMKNRGYKYIILSFHGFNGRLNEGEIYCGYQNKTDFNTTAWDSKNVETQFRVQGDTRGCIGIAIDLTTMEVVILNMMVEDESRVVHGTMPEVEKYLKSSFLEINMGAIIENRGTKVATPEEADVVFDDTYTAPIDAETGKATQKVVRTYELEKLVSLANGK